MLRPREVSPWKKLLFSYPTLFLLILLVALLFRSVYLAYLRERATAKLLSERRNELNQVETRVAAVAERVRQLNTPRGVEEEVRSRFQVAKPGEKVIVIVDQDATSTAASADTARFWSRVKKFFGF